MLTIFCRIKEDAVRGVEKAKNASFAQIKLAHQIGADAPLETISWLSLQNVIGDSATCEGAFSRSSLEILQHFTSERTLSRPAE